MKNTSVNGFTIQFGDKKVFSEPFMENKEFRKPRPLDLDEGESGKTLFMKRRSFYAEFQTNIFNLIQPLSREYSNYLCHKTRLFKETLLVGII